MQFSEMVGAKLLPLAARSGGMLARLLDDMDGDKDGALRASEVS